MSITRTLARVLKGDARSITARERFQTRRAQQSICDATNYILGNEEFGLCLDAGCGGNQYRQMLLKRCIKVIGIDLNLISAPNISRMDVLNIGFKDNIFDLVFSNQVIEHIYPKDYMRLFSELLRVCKPGGKIIILTPNQFGPTRFFEGSFLTYLDVDHKKEFNYFYAKTVKRQVEQTFNCKIYIHGYSSYDSDHKLLVWLWSWLPMQFREIAIKYSLLGRGIVFLILKSARQYD